MRSGHLFNSITFKLTLAFLLVGLTGSVLVAIFTWQRTQTAFNQFIFNREQQALVSNLLAYYQTYGTWTGISENLRIALLAQSPGGDPGRDFNYDWMRFVLADADRRVVYSILPGQIGQQVSSADLKSAITLVNNGSTIGWLILAPEPRERIPNSPEERFLSTVNSATLLSALIATALALILGGLLAFTLTRSLRELTEATIDISKGKFGLQVKVRSRDELGKLASSFNKMSLDLERATRARRQMTADIAHDLRSPLSVIAGYTEALSDGKLPSSPEIYNILHQETKHLNRLVDDLRTLSLADADELSLIFLPTQPQEILERVATRHAIAAQQNGVSLRVQAAEDLPSIMMDAERIAQVFDNLVLNAFRYTSAGGEIVLSAHLAEDQMEMTVQDNGCGIAPEDLPHVFDRFYRGDKSRQSTGESGLGLAIAKSLVEAHRGTLTVTSTPGQETTFTIRLPIQGTNQQDRA
jgi:two-component system, OmpR family, sensor histidine kinase BaeS